MTEKRFIVTGNWINDNYIGKLLNIDFNTITDAILCCDLLNQIEDEKKENGEIASNYLKENEQLKSYKNTVKDVLNSWSQKNLTAKQLQVVLAIMEELNIR